MASARQVISSLFLKEFVSAFFLSMRYFFKPKATLNYPFGRDRNLPASAVEHALRRYPNGEERCIACKLCTTPCRPQHPGDQQFHPRVLNHEDRAPAQCGKSTWRHLSAARRKCQGAVSLIWAARSQAVDPSSARNKRRPVEG